MPPSGYSEVQAKLVTEFLASCCAALREESIGAGRTPMQGLQKEITDIERGLSLAAYDECTDSLLRMTAGFYRLTLRAKPVDFVNFDALVPQLLEGVRTGILSVHV